MVRFALSQFLGETQTFWEATQTGRGATHADLALPMIFCAMRCLPWHAEDSSLYIHTCGRIPLTCAQAELFPPIGTILSRLLSSSAFVNLARETAKQRILLVSVVARLSSLHFSLNTHSHQDLIFSGWRWTHWQKALITLRLSLPRSS